VSIRIRREVAGQNSYKHATRPKRRNVTVGFSGVGHWQNLWQNKNKPSPPFRCPGTNNNLIRTAAAAHSRRPSEAVHRSSAGTGTNPSVSMWATPLSEGADRSFAACNTHAASLVRVHGLGQLVLLPEVQSIAGPA